MVDLDPEELATTLAILEEYLPGVTVWAFGSRISGRRRKPNSDLDLALISAAPLPLATLGMVDEAFAESDLPFRVDLVDWARASGEFRRIIWRVHEPVVTRGEIPDPP